MTLSNKSNNWRVVAKHPDYDAVVIIESRAGLVLVDFPAQGNSQRRAGGVVVGYTRRNPDRRALVLHVLATLGADFPGAAPIAAKGGKGGDWGATAQVDVAEGGLSAASKLYSAGRNYRFSLWLRGFFGDGDDALRGFNLVPTTHKSTAIEWPTGVDFDARITKRTGRVDLGFAKRTERADLGFAPYVACPACGALCVESIKCSTCGGQS